MQFVSSPHLSCRRPVPCRASGGESPSSSTRDRPTPGNDPRFRNGDPNFRPTPGNDPRLRGEKSFVAVPKQSDLEVVRLEDADVQGVAMVDSGEDDWESDGGRLALLVGGDAAVLLLFAALGRANHGEGLNADTLGTALPFLLGWFAVAPVLGGFGKEAQGGSVPAAAAAAARCWAVAMPLALVFRGVSRGYAPPLPFVGVALAATCVLLVGWRSGLAAVTTPEAELTPLEKFKRRKNKRGNVREFMQLLTSLTNRW